MATKSMANWYEPYAKKLIHKHQIPGTSIGISKGEFTYHKNFGYRYVEQGLETTSDTVFGIASITKSFTSMAIMQLQEAKKLCISDPINDYLPEFNMPNQIDISNIQIKHLLTNTSGLPPLPSLHHSAKRTMDIDPSLEDYPGLQVKVDNQGPIDTYEELMEFIESLDFEPLGPPGTKFSYSNEGFALLGAIIERVSGKKYENYIQDHILDPIGMTNTSFYLKELKEQNKITTLYVNRQNHNQNQVYAAPVWWDMPAMRAAGSLKSTTEDMLKYSQVFCCDGLSGSTRILDKSSIEEMMAPFIECGFQMYYGYGLMITPDFFGYKLVEHGGNLKGIASYMSILPEEGISGITLTNLTGSPAKRLMYSAFNCLLEQPAEKSHLYYHDYQIPDKDKQEYVGEYKSNEGMQIEIVLKAGYLTFTSHGASYPIKPIDKDLFVIFINDQEESFKMLRNDYGEISGVFYHLRQFPKVKSHNK